MVRIDWVVAERQIKGWDTLPTYVSTIKFNVPKVGIRFEIRHNKSDEYEPFDNIKKGLLKVVDNWVAEGNKIKESMGKYELVNLILDLYTRAITECEGEAFKVEYFEASDQVGKYIDKNKKKIETLNRIKEENKELDKQIKEEKIKNDKKVEDKVEEVIEEVVEGKPETKPVKKRVGRTKTTKAVKESTKAVKPTDLLPTSDRRKGMVF